MSLKSNIGLATLAIAFLLPTSCSKKPSSSTTGWKYNNAKWGGFETHEYAGQETGPGLVLIEGGSFTMGSSEQDVTYEHNNIERRITVPSFYMDATEVSNLHYREYLYWLERVYIDYPIVQKQALPDSLCWRDKLALNDIYVDNYFRHPAYQHYPVVGVSWLQATAYASWRTDRVNEYILIREGILKPDPTQVNDVNFNTNAYLAGQVEGKEGKRPIKGVTSAKRKVRMEDGIFLPDYRLPTEAEWEYAAYGNLGQSSNENTNAKKIYTWGGLTTRNPGRKEKNRGYEMANFKRDRGDQAGIAGKLNDGAFITTDVHAYWPNDVGLYNMSGNVSEWVMDVYRPWSYEDMTDFNSYRGNVFKKKKLDDDGIIDIKDSLGRLIMVNVTEEENQKRRNYRKSDNMGHLDEETYFDGEQGYEYGITSMINNKARVYKGGSWNDRAYWMSPGTRRFLDEEQDLSTLGFRCAMHRVGSSK